MRTCNDLFNAVHFLRCMSDVESHNRFEYLRLEIYLHPSFAHIILIFCLRCVSSDDQGELVAVKCDLVNDCFYWLSFR